MCLTMVHKQHIGQTGTLIYFSLFTDIKAKFVCEIFKDTFDSGNNACLPTIL